MPVPQRVTVGVAVDLGLVKFPKEGGHHMAVLQVVVVARPVEVGGHGGNEVGPVLVPVGLAEFDAGNLGDGVGFIGRFQCAGEQGVLDQGLFGSFG